MWLGHTAKDDYRVYLLGAGASYHDTMTKRLPLPLANQFFEEKYLEEFWRSRSNLVDYPFEDSNLHKILKHSFGFIRKERTAVNVEDVFSFLEVYLSTYNSNTSTRHILEEARRELLIYLIDLIRMLSKDRNVEDTIHNLVLMSLGKNDSVFTFNWDVLIDYSKELDIYWKKREPVYKSILNPYSGPLVNEEKTMEWHYREGVNKGDIGLILRLHGGVGLAHCADQSCPGNATPIELYPGTPVAEFDSCSFCGSELKSMILPPFVHKTYRSNRFINLQARLAADRIKSATELVIIGYSFPESDYEAITLLRLFRPNPDLFAGMSDLIQRKLIIVNPDAENPIFQEKLSRIFSPNTEKWKYDMINMKLYYSTEKFLNEDVKPRVDWQLKEYKNEREMNARKSSGAAGRITPPVDWWEK